MAKLTLPLATFSAATATAAEGVGTLNLTVNLSAAMAYTATVGYTTANSTATAGSDYLAQAGTLVFVPSQTSKTISVPIVNDPADEANETFTVTLNSPNNAALGTPSSTMVTITDDDPAPTVAWENTNVSGGEPSGSALVAVTLSAASAFTVTVVYSTTNGSALAGIPPAGDYTGQIGTLTFAPGVASRSVRPCVKRFIRVSGDTYTENWSKSCA